MRDPAFLLADYLGHRPKLTTALILAAVYGAFLFERM